MIGVTGTQVRLWEKGKAYPRSRTLLKVAEAIEITLPLQYQVDKYEKTPISVGAGIQTTGMKNSCLFYSTGVFSR